MTAASLPERATSVVAGTMRAAVFRGVDDIRLENVARPHPGPGAAVIRVTMATICGTDLQIARGDFPVRDGLILGQEAVGMVDELGPGVDGVVLGDRVLVSAITPCGHCEACLAGDSSQCGHGTGYGPLGGWRFGHTIHGSQAEYLLVHDADLSLAKIPEDLTDEQVVLLAATASAGIGAAEAGGVKLGDKVAVFAQGPVGVCASIGARLRGASMVIAVDGDDSRLRFARKMGIDVVLDYRKLDVANEILRLAGGVDVAIEALGSQQTFESALRVLRPGGTLSSIGLYPNKLTIPYEAFGAGLAGIRIVTTLCPGGKERMQRLMAMVRSGRLDLRPLITHRFSLSNIQEAYYLSANRLDSVMKVAIRP